MTRTSPAFTSSPTFFSIFQTVPGDVRGNVAMSEPLQEMGVQLAAGEGLAGQRFEVGGMLVFTPSIANRSSARACEKWPARAVSPKEMIFASSES